MALGLLSVVAPLLQPVILLLGDAQERSVLRTAHALNVTWRMEIAHVFVCQAQTVVLRTRRILYVANHPRRVACQLEGTHALALLVALEVHVVVLHRQAPRPCQLLGGGGIQPRLATLFLDHQVPLLVGLHPVDVGIDGGVAPVYEQSRLRHPGEALVGIAVVDAVVWLLVAVPHGIVDEVAALLPVGPLVGGIPHDLRSPHAVDGRPVLVDAWRLRVAEDGASLSEVEAGGLPVYEVVAT